MRNFILVKPGLHTVLTIGQHTVDRVLKRVFKAVNISIQIFLVKHEYLRSLQPCEDQGIRGKLKKACSQTCACDPYDLYGDQALILILVLKMSSKDDFKDLEAMKEKTNRQTNFFTQ